MFTNKIDPIISNGMETIGGNDIISKGIGTVICSWTDDDGQLHTKKVNNVLYFPGSLVNLLGAIALAEYSKDDKGTWVLT